MKSTIPSLNLVLGAVKNERCTSSQVCGIATMTITFNGEAGQGKIGACVAKSSCSDSAGCQLAIRYLPSGTLSQECKVLYIKSVCFCFVVCPSLLFSHEIKYLSFI